MSSVTLPHDDFYTPQLAAFFLSRAATGDPNFFD